MTISASAIELGKCYVTGTSSEVRRVVDLDMTEVTYETIGAGSVVSVTREKFAAEVDREVGCPE